MNTTVAGGLSIFAFLVVGVISLLIFAFWLWMLVDAITNKGLTDTEKILFVVLVFFLPFIGSLIYLLIGRPKRRLAAP